MPRSDHAKPNTRTGHERCWHCGVCGRPICPDCTLDGDTCSPNNCVSWTTLPAGRTR